MKRRARSFRRLFLSRDLAIVAACLVAGSGAAQVAQVAQTAAEPPAKYFIVLDGEPAAATFNRIHALQGQATALAAGRARAAEVSRQHEALSAGLRSAGVTELSRFSKLVNAICVRATLGQAAALRSLSGVRRVERVRTYEALTASSVPFIGTHQVWGGTPAADGTGIRMGIIDTGIDYTHADFGGSGVASDYASNNRTNIEPGTFPTAKVVGGWDFAGDNYNAGNPTNDTPHPDPDPLDCEGHGSHVAGIAAGFGVLTNGATYTGPYTNNLDFTQFKIGPGVAPQAKLYALKVFGCSGSTGEDVLVAALEWAADPNGDTNFSDHLDVVNLSLGARFGLTGPGDPQQDAVNMLADLGCVPVIAAGNDGETFYIVSSPGDAEKAITVACSIDNGTTTQGAQIVSPASIAGNLSAVEGSITVPLAQSGPIQAPVSYTQPADACSIVINGLSGQIALIDRGGSCNFALKIQQAQLKGALAVIMVNNVAGDPFIMSGSSNGITVPGVMISQSDGALIKAHLAEGVVARLDANNLFVHSELTDQLASFSSRGPAAPASLLKPEITAPGFTITSVKVGGGTLGVDMSGTSMSVPHVAGAAALLCELHPDWSTEEIKAAMMNTSRQTHDAAGNAYPESRIGAGRIEVDDAARTVVTAKAENSGGLVGLSFGALVLTNLHTQTGNVILSNHSASAVSYSVVVSNTVSENGVVVTSLVNNVTVPANGSLLVPVQLSADPALFDRTTDPTTTNSINGVPRQSLYETSGEIWFENTNLSIHVPYYANVRAASSMAAGLTTLALPITNGAVATTVPTGGASAHPQPLVSAFQLGAVGTNGNLALPESAADMLAVGAATDAATQTQFTNSRIYFGIGVAGDWATPQPRIAEFDVQIDTNADGTSDFTVFNTEPLNSTGSSSDAFETAVVIGTNSFNTLNSFINFYSATQRDTAPFGNSVMVLPVTVSSLGLSSARSQIRYRVRSFGPQTHGAVLIDQTDWITFDAARPVLDTATFGLGGRPFFNDGGNVVVKADVTAMAANGYATPGRAGLLLLHHFNTSGRRIETVDVQFPPQLLPLLALPGGMVLSWTSASNGLYTLQYATNLNEGFVFQAAAGLPATPPFNTFIDSNAVDPARFYRVFEQ